MFSAASGFTGDFWERFLLEKVKFDIIFLPCLVISPPVSQDYGDPACGDGEGLAAGKCLWFFVIIGVGFYHFWCGFYHFWGFFPLFLSSQIATVCKLSSGCARGDTNPHGNIRK